MPDGISVDLGSALPYLVDRLASLLGKDAETRGWKLRIDKLTKMALDHASHVQCMGMANPVPISEIYQPTRILLPRKTDPWAPREISLEQLLKKEDAVIKAGPGRGKTTLLNWTYTRLCTSKEFVPLLFPLRWPSATDDLCDFVSSLHAGRPLTQRKNRVVVLLIDGYDEVSEDDRRRISQALLLFKALHIGRFYLTCRSFYHIYDLKVPECELCEFSEEDALRFVEAFSNLYGAHLDAPALLTELHEHGFRDFAAHPLMLTLVCILKSGPDQAIPRRAIGLIRRAIETLTFRWDEAKSIHRSPQVPVDGEERVRCLMKIAFDMTTLEAPYSLIESSARKHLDLIQMRAVNVHQLLTEMAQWYGMLIPADSDNWTFVHRTIHDFLAARFWVESGTFSDVSTWDIRAAYATCLLPDATFNMRRMLDGSEFPMAFCECLYNKAAFDPLVIANAVAEVVQKTGRFELVHTTAGIRAELDNDFYHLCSVEFLESLLAVGGHRGTEAGEVIGLYAIAELYRRQLRATTKLLVNGIRALYETNRNVIVHVLRSFSSPPSVHEFKLSDAIVQ